ALQEDATLSMDALAERVHLSRNAAWRRVKLLEEARIITGRVALADPAKLGAPLMAVVLIRAGTHGPEWATRFARAVKMPQIVSAYRMTGDLDYLLRVRVADMAGYDGFYKELTARIDISDVSASFVMEEIVETTAIPVGVT
ncbi:MAG: Lrp/AsnC family transcriptional regulator, partial [Pseudomonadota bacterium]